MCAPLFISQLFDGFFGLARQCEAGDIRTRFSVVAPSEISVLATQGEGGALLPYISKVRDSDILEPLVHPWMSVIMHQATHVNVALVMPGILSTEEVRVAAFVFRVPDYKF